MKDYEISIITPFHKTDLNMFRKAFKSMTSQTFGIENIQWIIVVHNSPEEDLAAVREIVKGYDSIEVYTLNNDVHSASSPRNYGMEHATGKYLEFLDADDSLTPACVETVLKHIKATQSQMLVFRIEYELDDPNCMPLAESMLWNQTINEIVVERGQWDKAKMFGGAWGFVASKLYDREFLVREGIKFNEDIAMCEDQYFAAMAFGKVQRICYLPNFIGYHYFIHSSSATQSVGRKSGSVCVKYAHDFNKVLALCLHNEIPIDILILFWSHILLTSIMGSPDITLEQIREIRDVMRPYSRMAEMIKPSKILSQAEIDSMYAASQKLMYPEELFAARRTYADNLEAVDKKYRLLAKIVDDNSTTDMAQRYGAKDYHDFLKAVPLSSYDDYEQLIALTTRIGEKNVFTSLPVMCYALTSGTMGQARYIPCTKEHVEDFTAEFARLLDNKRSLALFESMPKTFTNDGAYIDTISGITLRYFAEKDPKLAEYLLASPHELLFPHEASNTLYARLVFALKDNDIRQIIAPFTWGVHEMFAGIEKNWEALCSDIEAGEISPSPMLPESVREALNKQLTPDKERADELRGIFARGFGEPVAQKIWPKLERVIAAGTGAFEVYTDNMRRYTGNVPHSNGIYASSEAVIARAEEDESDKYILCPENAFFEFVPLGGDKPVSFEELEAGKAYELVVTNKSGFWRYRLRDIVTIVNADTLAPIITFNYRAGHDWEFRGVSMTEYYIYRALKDTVMIFGIDMADFAYWADEDAGTWKIFIEPYSRSVDAVMNVDVEHMSDMFSLRLEQINPQYSRALGEGVIGPCEIHFNQPETHLLYRDVVRYRSNVSPAQIKPVHFVDAENEVIKRFFTKNILEVKED